MLEMKTRNPSREDTAAIILNLSLQTEITAVVGSAKPELQWRHSNVCLRLCVRMFVFVLVLVLMPLAGYFRGRFREIDTCVSLKNVSLSQAVEHWFGALQH